MSTTEFVVGSECLRLNHAPDASLRERQRWRRKKIPLRSPKNATMPTTTPAIAPRGNFECVEPSMGTTSIAFAELVEKVEGAEAVELLPIEAVDKSELPPRQE